MFAGHAIRTPANDCRFRISIGQSGCGIPTAFEVWDQFFRFRNPFSTKHVLIPTQNFNFFGNCVVVYPFFLLSPRFCSSTLAITSCVLSSAVLPLATLRSTGSSRSMRVCRRRLLLMWRPTCLPCMRLSSCDGVPRNRDGGGWLGAWGDCGVFCGFYCVFGRSLFGWKLTAEVHADF